MKVCNSLTHDHVLVLTRISLQFLGAAPLPRPWTRLSDMGDVTKIRSSELGIRVTSLVASEVHYYPPWS